MSLIFGTRGTGNWDTEERLKDHLSVLFKYRPNHGSFVGLLSKLSEDAVGAMKYYVYEESPRQTQFTVNGAQTNVDTTIELSGTTPAKALRAGDMLRNVRTGEILRVASDPVSAWTEFTASTRGSFAETDDKAAMNDGDILELMPATATEFSSSFTAVSETTEGHWNYLQDVEEPCAISNWAEDDELEVKPGGEAPWSREKRRAADTFKEKLSRAFYFGKRKTTTVGGELIYFTGGLDFFCTTNRFDDSSSGTSLDGMLAHFQSMRSVGQGSATKWGFAGVGAINRINKLVRESTTGYFDMSAPMDKRKTWGLNMMELRGPTMTLQLIEDEVLSANSTDTNKVMIVDPKYVKLAVKKGKYGKIKYEDVDVTGGARYKKGRYRGIVGLILGQEKVHGVWTVGSYLP